jgi:hypothetical protein
LQADGGEGGAEGVKEGHYTGDLPPSLITSAHSPAPRHDQIAFFIHAGFVIICILRLLLPIYRPHICVERKSREIELASNVARGCWHLVHHVHL